MSEHNFLLLFNRLFGIVEQQGTLVNTLCDRMQSIERLLSPLADIQSEPNSAVCVEKKIEPETRLLKKVHFYDDVSFEPKTENIVGVSAATPLEDLGALVSLLRFCNCNTDNFYDSTLQAEFPVLWNFLPEQTLFGFYGANKAIRMGVLQISWAPSGQLMRRQGLGVIAQRWMTRRMETESDGTFEDDSDF